MRFLVLVLIIALLPPPVAAAEAPPTLVGAVTGGAGTVERIVLPFDAPVELGSVSSADFAMSPCPCTPASVSLVGTDEVHLTVTTTDTAWTPQVTYTSRADGLQSAGGKAVASFSVKAADATPPVLLSATAWGIGRSDAVLLFSEPVSWKGNLAEGLTKADLGYDDLAGGGATAIDGVIHSGKSARADLVLRGGFAAADDGVDRVRILADAVADQAGNVAAAGAVPVVLDRTPPAAVTGFTATVAGSSAIALKLTVPSDEDVERLEIRMAKSSFNPADFAAQQLVAGAPSRITPSMQVNMEVKGLDAGQHHFFAAQALDRNGNRGPVSEVVAATTHRDTFPPDPPSQLTVPSGGLGTRWLGLSWTVPADHDGTPIERYELRIAKGKTTDPQSGKFVEPPRPGAPGATQRFLIGDLEPNQIYTVALRSIDPAGMLSGWMTLEATTGTDETPPEGTLKITSPTHNAGEVSEKSVLDVAWSGAKDDQSPIVYLYRINHNPSSHLEWSDFGTTDTKLTGHVLGDGRWFVHVAAMSAGGMLVAEPFEVIVDREAPPAPRAPQLLAAGYGSLQVTIPASPDAATQELRWSLEPITDANWGRANKAGSVTRSGELLVADVPPETPIHLAAKAIDAAGRASDVGANLVATALLDPSPPEWEANVHSASHATPQRSLRLHAEWAAASDEDTAVTYHYVISRDADVTVAQHNDATSEPEVLLSVEQTGAWYLHVRPRSAGGWAQQATLPFEVLPVPPQELAAARDSIDVTVRREGASNLVSWSFSDRPPAGLMGVQLWVGNSPYELLANLTPVQAHGTFNHTGPDALATSRYLVTPYFSLDMAGGFFGGLLSPPESLQGTSAALPGSPAWIPMVAWSFGTFLVVAGLGTGGWMAWQRHTSKRNDLAQAADAEPWTAPEQDAEWHEFNGDADDWAMDEEELGLDAV